MNNNRRLDRLKKVLESESIDALLIRKKQNIKYLVGTRGEGAILFVSPKKNFLITDHRYKEEYAGSVSRACIKTTTPKNIYACVREVSDETRARRIGFESDSFSYSNYLGLKKNLKNKKLVPVKEAVESLRAVKDSEEIKYIRAACRQACCIMKYALEIVRPSRRESYIKREIELYGAKRGLKFADFGIIVASGKNASMPHAPISEKKIKKQEMVIIDLGAMNYGYNSDLTRTVFLGRIDRKYQELYNIVLSAQSKAIEAIRPGVSIKSIDNISRKYISSKGMGRCFIHSLGHGIGLEVHEKPHISGTNNAVLKKNMVLTVEPAVYIPGWGGIRVEDDVLVTRDGYEVLTKQDRGLLCK